ncbi:MAG: cell filamentation protein Fic, partial [Phycisphaerales bacterium]
MVTTFPKTDNVKLAGYAFLIRHFNLQVLPHWHISQVGGSTHQQIIESDGRVCETFTNKYWPGDIYLEHFEFALKYDGINLEILSEVFDKVNINELTSWIISKPQSQYTRRIWYLYEWMKNKRLEIEDLTSGNYIDLLDEEKYYTAQNETSSRHHVRNNLLGNFKFCPVIRKTEVLNKFEASDLSDKCRKILAKYPDDFLKRALS